MTPHINALETDIAKTVIMPGDPLRAKYIAETYLTDYKLVSSVRNMYAYTGFYKNKRVTVMGSGMGIPCMGIYSYELYKFYNVENIIRVGTAGAYTTDLNLYDILLVKSSYSKSSYAKVQANIDDHILYSNESLNEKIRKTALDMQIDLKECQVCSSEAFYNETEKPEEMLANNCLACEMESFALFENARYLNKKAACLLTISDNIVTKEATSSQEREKNLNKMIELALETI
ncbi:MAG: purine-nucleoside phosphorylase [Erysipelotrichaceae bacterium]|nr:purine-nucleoside phosphorylase [Erysipelotrichaceae bacterium]